MIRRLDLAAAPPAVRSARDWLETRSRREQMLLTGLAALAVVAVVWYGLALPVMGMREASIARTETAARLMMQLAAQPSGAASPAATAAPLDGDLIDVVRRRAADAGLSAEGIEADGDAVQVVIADARFDAVVPFVAALEGADGAVVQTLRIDRTGAPGMVSLNLQVSR